MTLLVPFDASELATNALDRASTFGNLLGEEVVVLTVIPADAEYARSRNWITMGEPFDADAIESGLRSRAEAVAPEATFRTERVSSDEPTATATTQVVREIRRVAGEIDASVVFIGSENAGSVIAPQSSVGSPVANDQRYDVYVVREPSDEADPTDLADIDSTTG
ncbi:universal stress protein [Natrarchaeobius oligotrophus]|uniref:Universal stress protein n=1 Tax=Natrarchaeobius chitinivorans TaxID=1679083 RepID=A0A3N6PJY3_NATCH|nr:universal stress protein [Natrarchaeobius chitinivorans]RQH01470.1 universal stress protein [Natrarchaeobius chitinivorans]